LPYALDNIGLFGFGFDTEVVWLSEERPFSIKLSYCIYRHMQASEDVYFQLSLSLQQVGRFMLLNFSLLLGKKFVSALS
jgi:hypothetical protein